MAFVTKDELRRVNDKRMTIWYVDSWYDAPESGESHRHLFASKAEATRFYQGLVHDAKARLKAEYKENDGTFLDGSPRKKEWLDKECVRLETCGFPPKWFSLPSQPTKAQIIQTFDCW